MQTIEKRVNMDVPADTVFRYLKDPTHLLEVCANVVQIDDIHNHSNDVRFAYIFKMVGVRFEGYAQIHEVVHARQLDMHIWGGINGDLSWHFVPDMQGMQLKVELHYDIPEPLLPKHDKDAIARHNERNLEGMLEGLKVLLEAKPEAIRK